MTAQGGGIEQEGSEQRYQDQNDEHDWDFVDFTLPQNQKRGLGRKKNRITPRDKGSQAAHDEPGAQGDDESRDVAAW